MEYWRTSTDAVAETIMVGSVSIKLPEAKPSLNVPCTSEGVSSPIPSTPRSLGHVPDGIEHSEAIDPAEDAPQAAHMAQELGALLLPASGPQLNKESDILTPTTLAWGMQSLMLSQPSWNTRIAEMALRGASPTHIMAAAAAVAASTSSGTAQLYSILPSQLDNRLTGSSMEDKQTLQEQPVLGLDTGSSLPCSPQASLHLNPCIITYACAP
ncbi:hypothetical protein V8C86DRAFT_662407 [Haematococcus lacustris]